MDAYGHRRPTGATSDELYTPEKRNVEEASRLNAEDKQVTQKKKEERHADRAYL